jgi:hypothetical protein
MKDNITKKYAEFRIRKKNHPDPDSMDKKQIIPDPEPQIW